MNNFSEQMMELAVRGQRYIDAADPAKFPFKVGNMVTPVHGTSLRGAGEPHVVVGFNTAAQPDFTGEIGTSRYGTVLNLRVLCNNSECYAAFWVEAAEFELFALAEGEK